MELDGACVPDLAQGWQRVDPPAEAGTICSRGTPFYYYVRPGTVNKLVVGFDGGGACWDAVTCSEANPSFSEEVGNNDNPAVGLTDGALDFNDPENPVSDWFVIFIPYCTGDIHWGDSVTTYKAKGDYPSVTINHKGFVNGMAVMSWVQEHFSAPEDIMVTGISAGAYGSLMFAPYYMEAYPDARVLQNGDSGAGVVSQSFMIGQEGFNAWGAWDNFPAWLLEDVTQPLATLTFADAYILSAQRYPHQMFSQYNTNSDDVQEVFYAAMGGRPGAWSTQMNAMVTEIAATVPNFRYYTAWGSMHGILAYDEFYTYQVDGYRVSDWFTQIIDGEDVPNVHCTDCETPEYYEP